MSGPLSGLRILELAGIGPGPFCGMMLADMGAEVIRIDRPGGNPSAYVGHNVLFRNRRSIALDLKTPRRARLRCCSCASTPTRSSRASGPASWSAWAWAPTCCLARNPRLVYGRMTGWGQDGPLRRRPATTSTTSRCRARCTPWAAAAAAHAALEPGGRLRRRRHDAGVRHGVRLLEAQRSGQGQVVDTSMVEGSAALMAMFYGLRAQGMFTDQRGTHMLDTGAHFYDTYETSDGKHVAIGSIETKFYQLLMEKAELDPAVFGKQLDTRRWPDQKARLAEVMRGKTRDEWCALMEGTDVCFAPVLSIAEAPQHPHNVARESFVTVEGAVQPRPTPRFSRTPSGTPTPARMPGTDTLAVLRECGFDQNQLDALLASGAIAQL
jgi:alpha-methylacyl-CoA racemase